MLTRSLIPGMAIWQITLGSHCTGSRTPRNFFTVRVTRAVPGAVCTTFWSCFSMYFWRMIASVRSVAISDASAGAAVAAVVGVVVGAVAGARAGAALARRGVAL